MARRASSSPSPKPGADAADADAATPRGSKAKSARPRRSKSKAPTKAKASIPGRPKAGTKRKAPPKSAAKTRSKTTPKTTAKTTARPKAKAPPKTKPKAKPKSQLKSQPQAVEPVAPAVASELAAPEPPRRRRPGRPRRGRPGRPPQQAPVEPAAAPVEPSTALEPVTGVLSAAAIRSQAAHILYEARQQGRAVTFAAFDADDFSEVNAVVGAEVGDRFLKAFARRLAGAKPRDEVQLGRIAGDIFLMVIDGAEPEECFLEVEAARQAVSRKALTTGRGATLRKQELRASVGLAGFPKDGDDAAAVLSRALAALRRAKRLGKDRVGLPPDDNMVTKTSHYPLTQLDALRDLSQRLDRGEADLLREALEDLLLKFKARR